MFFIFLFLVIFIPVFIVVALADACGASQRKLQTRRLIKAQRDLAIEKGEIKAPPKKVSLWDRIDPPIITIEPLEPSNVTAPRKVTGEVYNFTTQKWENTYAK